MATYVLVHGAWRAGWCWKRVARPLRDAGHDVFTPTMSGLGERAYYASPDVDLDRHVADILAVIEAEELSDVILCGHSYGGMVITGVADRVADKLRALVYLDAFVPEAGQAQFDMTQPERAAAFRKLASEHGDGWKLPPPTPESFGIVDPADIAWLNRRCRPQPIATFGQPLPQTGAWKTVKPRVYIRASKHPMGTFQQFTDKFRDDPDWDYREIPTVHDVMITMPGALTEMLLELAD